MVTENTVSLKLHGLVVEVASHNKAFMLYLKKQFSFYCFENFEQDIRPDIKINVASDRSAFKKILDPHGNGFRRISTNTSLSDHGCVYKDKIGGRRTEVELCMEGRQMRVAAIQEQKNYHRIFKRENDDSKRRACYHFVYCPLFFYLQHFYAMHPLHAGAFSVSEKTFVIAGLDKMGKTTLSLESLRIPGAEFISDNIIFHDDKKITPCYAPIKIRGGDKISVPPAFRKIAQVGGQSFFAPPASSEGQYKPDIVIIPCFSERPFLKEVPGTEASSVIMNINMIASEIREYLGAATFWNLMVGGEPLLVRQNRALTALLQKAKCYYIGISRNEKPENTIDRVVNLIKMEEKACQ